MKDIGRNLFSFPFFFTGLFWLGILAVVYSPSLQLEIKTKIQTRLLNIYLEKIAVNLPFEITHVDLDLTFDSWKARAIPIREIGIRRDALKLFIRGTLSWKDLPHSVHSNLTIENSIRPELDGRIVFDFYPDPNAKDWLTLSYVPNDTGPGNLPEKLGDLHGVTLLWNRKSAKVHAELASLGWGGGSDPNQARIEGLSLDLEAFVKSKDRPFDLNATLKAKSFEALAGSIYLGGDLKGFTLRGKGKSDLSSVELNLTQKANSVGEKLFQAKLDQANPQTNVIRFELMPLPVEMLKPLLDGISQDLALSKGNISARGTLRVDLTKELPEEILSRISHLNMEGTVSNADLEIKSLSFLAGGLNATLKVISGQKPRLTARAQWLDWLHFSGPLEETVAEFEPDFSYINIPTGIPWKLPHMQLTIGPIQGNIGIVKEKPLKLETQVSLSTSSLVPIAQGVCLKTELPQGTLKADFSRVIFGTSPMKDGQSIWIEPEGKVTVKTLGGILEVTDASIYDLGTEVPELRLSAKWDDLNLSQIGKYLGFGEMDGFLKGFFRDAIFQSWLPTRFYFETRALPNKPSSKDIVFSPEAMKNVVRIFMGDDIQSIPGIAQWMAFGWPSRILGGFDVEYAGASVFSQEGSILIETFDSEEVLLKNKGHYFLYGPRFKMPLNSSRYPLVVDAPAMGNFVRHMLDQFQAIAKEKGDRSHEQDSKKSNQENTECKPLHRDRREMAPPHSSHRSLRYRKRQFS